MQSIRYFDRDDEYHNIRKILLRYNTAKCELERCKDEQKFWLRYAKDCSEVWEHINTLRLKVRQLLALRVEIEQAINALDDDRLRLIMRYRYIEGLTWDAVSNATNYEYRWMLRLHKRALAILDEKQFTNVQL